MRRRDFLGLAAGVALGVPRPARAQQVALPTIGFLDTASAETTAPFLAAFHRGLAEVGYVVGKNLLIEYRWPKANYDELPGLAADLVARGVAVLATVNTPSVLAAQASTRTIPIIFAVGVNPVKFGLVQSLASPGGNLTGVTQLTIETEAKRLQLVTEVMPGARTIAFLVNPLSPAYSAEATTEALSAAAILGVRLLVLNASSPNAIEEAFAIYRKEGAQALLVSGDSFLLAQRQQLITLAAQNAVPAIYHRREVAAAGGLMSYGPSLSEAYQQVGVYTGRILKGEKPADLPVHQSSRLELVINLKTADTLGLAIPPSILLRAEEVIE